MRINIDEIKTSVDVAEVITRYLGAPRGHGRHRKWLCPFHNDRTPSLSLTPDGGAFICWSCDTKGDAVAFVQRIENLGFVEAATLLANGNYQPASRPDRVIERAKSEAAEQERISAARNLCIDAVPIGSTLAERYLRETRGIESNLPTALRFHPEVPDNILHLVTPQLRVRYLPALVAEIRNAGGDVTGAHVIYLRITRGRVQKADIRKAKVSFGLCRGGAVRLAEPVNSLGICEGIEDGLSVLQLAEIPVWPVAGTSFLPLIDLPPTVLDLHIYGQNDEPGRKAATKAAEAHTMPGRRVVIHFPPAPHKDWNDFVKSRASL